MNEKLRVVLPLVLIFFLSCTTTQSGKGKNGEKTAVTDEKQVDSVQGSPFGPNPEFKGSPFEEVGRVEPD